MIFQDFLVTPEIREHNFSINKLNKFTLNKLLIWCLLIVSKVVVKLGIG